MALLLLASVAMMTMGYQQAIYHGVVGSSDTMGGCE
jgi:hypothetical protein